MRIICRRGVRLNGPSKNIIRTPQGGARHYVQHGEKIFAEQHGAGLISHQSIADRSLPKKVAGTHNLVQAAPAADLFRTKVHEGLGTSEKDPYQRTLPNVELQSPESTVMRSIAPAAPTLEELAMLNKKWDPLQVWLSDTNPRLPLFLRMNEIERPLPVSAKAVELLKEVDTSVIPNTEGITPDEVQRLREWWKLAMDKYQQCASHHIFSKQSFTATLEDVHRTCSQEIESSPARNELQMALEVLRRQAVEEHNKVLREMLSYVYYCVESGRGASQTWNEFLTAMEECKADIFLKKAECTLLYAWEALMAQGTVHAPLMSAPVALFFTLGTIYWKQKVKLDTNATTATSSSRYASAAAQARAYAEIVPVSLRRKYVIDELTLMCNTPSLLRQLAARFHAVGNYELHRDLSLYEAMTDDATLRRTEAESLVSFFDNPAEVKSLFASIYGGNDMNAKHHLVTSLRVPKSNLDWERVLQDADWKNKWRQLTTVLLMHVSFLNTACDFISNAVGAKGVEQQLFHSNTADALRTVVQARKDREMRRTSEMERLTRLLSSYEMVDRSIQALLEVGSKAEPLEREAQRQQAKSLLFSDIPLIPLEVLHKVLEGVRARHPSWVASGVIPAMQDSMSSERDVLRVMTRMFIRITHVPQAGAAMIAQHTRHRIGNVGLSSTQYNIPAEFGMVEQFDNLLYKRYDWQGWYQRMVDIHNRNVSIRCQLGDLKQLDANGNPFVDLQTERRLRILCGERVGMGVLKLDSDKYEDQEDNITFGTTKLSEIFAESKKAQLGPEYWPTVEVKVRKPSGQSQAYYSLLDNDRIEKKSAELFEKYKEAKKRKMFVTPMDLWLEIKGSATEVKHDGLHDKDGYAVTSLHESLQDSDTPKQ